MYHCFSYLLYGTIYTWGDPADTVNIYIEGEAFQATSNLHAALCQLREKGHKSLWVDAVCINQTDLEEKNIQLLQMGAIYQRANQTIAWLGNEADDSNKAFATIEAIAAEDRSPLVTSASLRSLKPLLQRPYWRRIWIVQELALSRETTLVCGSCELSLAIFFSAMLRLKQNTQEVSHTVSLQQFCQDVNEDKPVRLLDALFRTRTSLASDPKDKVFAFLGLTYNGSAHVPVPNYAQSDADVCLEITLSAISLSKSLDAIVFLAEQVGYQIGFLSTLLVLHQLLEDLNIC